MSTDMDTTTETLVEQAHAALEASRRVDHVEMQSPPIVFRHAAKVLREWDGKRVALTGYIAAVRAAIAEDHNAALALNAETCSGYCDAADARPCEHELDRAARRVLALTSAADLDAAIAQ